MEADIPKYFFTYVWGPPGNPAWPLTFSTKAARRNARAALAEGDIVFTVCTKGDPTPPEYWGQVSGVYIVSDLEINTQDYDLPSGGLSRFPYALHPISVWQITSDDNIFAKLVGPLTPIQHLRAQSQLVELDMLTANPLLALDRREVSPAQPKTEFGKGLVAVKNSKLAPKHEGTFVGRFGDHEIWFVYTLVLRDIRNKSLALKVGYSNSPSDRENAHNGPMASEVTGLKWKLDFSQPTSSEGAARKLEQAVLQHYSRHRLVSNGEILREVDPSIVILKIAEIMRSSHI